MRKKRGKGEEDRDGEFRKKRRREHGRMKGKIKD